MQGIEFTSYTAVRQATEMQKSINLLLLHVNRQMRRKKQVVGTLGYEAELFKAILGFKSGKHRKDKWLLSSSGLTEISNDFRLLLDFHFGQHTTMLDRWVNIYGKLFLSPTEVAELDALDTGDDKGRVTVVRKYASMRIRMLWYFVVSVCRILQNDDYWLLPTDAYWLGLVDEVVGANLPNERWFMENPLPALSSP